MHDTEINNERLLFKMNNVKRFTIFIIIIERWINVLKNKNVENVNKQKYYK